ncbi:MAG: gliding motility-associated C-terminal domain-containing protein, partial [Saprospiraceae bacterium]
IFGDPKCVRGVNGYALLFDGVDDFIQVPHSQSLNSINTEVTVVGWVYPLSIYRNGFIIVTTKGNTPGLVTPTPYALVYRTYLSQNLYPYLRFASSTGQLNPVDLDAFPNSLVLNRWSFIAWRFKSGQLDIFLNDRKVASYTYNYSQLYKNTDPVEFARDAYGETEFFHGILDEFCMFNRALSDNELLMTYQKGKDPQSFISTTIDTTICPGQSYNGYNVSGTYIDTLYAQTGCDSVVKINLKVLPNMSFTLDTTICQGENYEGYTTAGNYIDTLQCSIRTLQLKIKPSATSSITTSICAGESYEGRSLSGIYRDTFTAANGCDSVRIIDLKVIQPTVFSESVTICKGENYKGFTDTGMYIDTLPASSGCDSIYMLNLLVKEDQLVRIDTAICSGASVAGYSLPGIYEDQFTTKEGCDSTRILQLSIKPNVESFITQFICEGDAFEGYTISGIYKDTFSLGLGCDSIRTLDLQVGSIYIPNAFSPNGDDINDTFQVFAKSEAVSIKNYQIFDRWGSLIYEAKDFLINDNKKWWDGYAKGKKMNDGIYVYYIEISCSDNIIPFKGEITILNK